MKKKHIDKALTIMLDHLKEKEAEYNERGRYSYTGMNKLEAQCELIDAFKAKVGYNDWRLEVKRSDNAGKVTIIAVDTTQDE